MRIYLEILLLIIAIAVVGCFFFYPSDILLSPSSNQNTQNQVCLRSRCFFVESAKTNAEREKGLMFREELDVDKGMLFIFDKEDIYPFWMKNTLIPLDIIWLDKDNKIVFINKTSQPCNFLYCPKINPEVSAKYVLEINAGIIDEIGLKIGDRASLNIPKADH